MFTIRPYRRDDYDDFLRIDTATQSRAFWSEADWHPIHPPCDDTPEVKRYVVMLAQSSRVVGYGAVMLTEQSNLDVMIDPTWQRRGAGKALWERMRQDLAMAGTVTVGPWVRAENTGASDWLAVLGFVHVHKDGPVQLFVADADVSSFAAVTNAVAKQGITLTTLAEEQERYPDCRAQFYRLFREVEKDVVGYSPENATSYAQCMQELDQPGMQPESVFIAIHNGEYVGLSILRRKVTEADVRFAGANSLSQHLTGVRREYRRRGIAHALKIHTIGYARQHGFQRILSNSDNPAMRDLNWKLGFRTGPWLIYNRVLDESESSEKKEHQ